MVSRLRIARLDPKPYQSLAGEPPDADAHRRLDALIRRYLAGPTASLLAAPKPTADGRFVEWYSDLSGQPVVLASLSPVVRAPIEALLADRLSSLAALADRLDAAGSDVELTRTLRQALSYPGDETIFVVDGQPVVAFWGYQSAAAAAAAAQAAASPAAPAAGASAPASLAASEAAMVEPAASDRRLPRWLLPALGLLAVLLAIIAVFATGVLRWPPWGPDYVALLRAAGDEEQALRGRIAALTADLQARRTYCDVQRDFSVAAADEQRLTARLADALTALAAARELCPLRGALAQARQEGADLETRRASAAQILAAQLERCRKQAEAEARKVADERKHAEAELKKVEAERRKAEKAQHQAEAAARAAREPPPAATTPKPPEQPGQPAQQQAATPPLPPPPPAARSAPPGMPPCPGERTPEEAPDAAIVLDASGSMRLPASASLSEVQGVLSQLGPLGMLGGAIFGQVAGGPSRLEAAKRGINSVVGSMPNDVDVGLVTLQRCPHANNEGFFSGAERGRLYARVNALSPMQGTPLAQGIMQAGQMIDGVKVPAVMVVISDGDDSCGGDPCAAAQALRQSKPLLKINVVDILGNGALACLARATGGQVLKPGDGVAFERAIKQAAQDAIKPAYCH